MQVCSDVELDRERTIKNFLIVRKEGKRYVSREVEHYSIDVVFEVGIRIRKSQAGREIRRWSQQVLTTLTRTGYLINEERLASGDVAYYDEIRARLRAIRRSESLLYEKARAILATSVDYNPQSQEAKNFYASIQNRLHYAVTGKTAPEIIHARANHEKPNMGLLNWRGKNIVKDDIKVAKNYETQSELEQLENLIDQFLLFGEFQLLRRHRLTMQDWINSIDELVTLNRCEVLKGKGKMSRSQAEKRAQQEWEKYQELIEGREALEAYQRQVLQEIELETRQYLEAHKSDDE